jgi:hypothetical protein
VASRPARAPLVVVVVVVVVHRHGAGLCLGWSCPGRGPSPQPPLPPRLLALLSLLAGGGPRLLPNLLLNPAMLVYLVMMR